MNARSVCLFNLPMASLVLLLRCMQCHENDMQGIGQKVGSPYMISAMTESLFRTQCSLQWNMISSAVPKWGVDSASLSFQCRKGRELHSLMSLWAPSRLGSCTLVRCGSFVRPTTMHRTSDQNGSEGET